jgi:hypothetical protein
MYQVGEQAFSNIEDQCYFAVLVFRKNEANQGTFLHMTPMCIIGSEIILVTPSYYYSTGKGKSTQQREVDSIAYFSEVGSTFRSSSVSARKYREETHFSLSIKINEQEHVKLQRYLVDLVAMHVPYCTASLPLMALPDAMQWLFYDVYSEKPGSFNTLTSCQGILFALRNSLDDSRSVTSCLSNVQGRFVSPARLHQAVQAFSRPCKVMPLSISSVVRQLT